MTDLTESNPNSEIILIGYWILRRSSVNWGADDLYTGAGALDINTMDSFSQVIRTAIFSSVPLLLFGSSTIDKQIQDAYSLESCIFSFTLLSMMFLSFYETAPGSAASLCFDLQITYSQWHQLCSNVVVAESWKFLQVTCLQRLSGHRFYEQTLYLELAYSDGNVL